MRKRSLATAVDSGRLLAGVELAVLVDLVDGTEDLSETTDERLEEEERNPYLERDDDGQSATDVFLVVTDFGSDLAPTANDGDHEQHQSERSEDGLVQAKRARSILETHLDVTTLGSKIDNAGVWDSLVLLRLFLFANGVPYTVHESLVKHLDTGEEIVWEIVPDDERATVGDEGGEVVLLAVREKGDVGDDLEAETVLEADEVGGVLAQEHGDERSADGDGTLDIELLDGSGETVGDVGELRWAASVVTRTTLDDNTLILRTTVPEAAVLLLVEPESEHIPLALVDVVVGLDGGGARSPRGGLASREARRHGWCGLLGHDDRRLWLSGSLLARGKVVLEETHDDVMVIGF